MVSPALQEGPPVKGQEVSEGPRHQSNCSKTGRLARPGVNRAGREMPRPGMSSQPPGGQARKRRGCLGSSQELRPLLDFHLVET